MLQATQDRYGGPEVIELRAVPRPTPHTNDVLIRLEAAALTLADTAFRKADPFIVRFFGGLFRPKRGLVHGAEFAGVVEAVGSAVTRVKPGDAVFGATGTALGAHAEYLMMAEDAAFIHRPADLDPVGAAGLAYSFLTAMPFLRDEGQLKAGQRIAIYGASSSIGLTAVQLARHMGAHVTAICSGRNAGLVREAGAHEVIDRRSEDFVDRGVAYDVIFDAVGKRSFAACRKALTPAGIYLTTVPSFAILGAMLFHRRPDRQRGRLATTGLRSSAAKVADLALIEGLVASGALRPIIDRVFPLAEIVEAHRYVDTQTKRGEVVIRISA